MPYGYFSKVYPKLDFEELARKINLQRSKPCKPIEYIELTSLEISQGEFDIICNDISHPHKCYAMYARQSIAESDGKWRCIILVQPQSEQRLVLYTAGRLYPLYASVY